MRLPPDASDLLDREAERTGRYPATLVADLIRANFGDPAGRLRHPAPAASAPR